MTFPFDGDVLGVVTADEQHYVVLARLCEPLGLRVDGQAEKLRSLEWACTQKIWVRDPLGREQETVCLNIRSVAGWLFTVNAGKVAPHLREKLIRYQRTCADALADHFLGLRRGAAFQPEMSNMERMAMAIAPIIANVVVAAVAPFFTQRAPAPRASTTAETIPQTYDDFVEQEQTRIRLALVDTGWNRKKAAELLQMSRRTFYRRLDEYGIQTGDTRRRRPTVHLDAAPAQAAAIAPAALMTEQPRSALIGHAEAMRSILGPVQRLAELRARVVGRPSDRKLIRSFRAEIETDLREALNFPRAAGHGWQNFPSARLGDALLALNSMRVKAERFAGRAAKPEQLPLPGGVVSLDSRRATSG